VVSDQKTEMQQIITPNSPRLKIQLVTSLLAAVFFSKGHLDQCLVIANTKEQYGGGQIGKKVGQGSVAE